ncbi:MAG TPA: Re/Si-specific NAD(P)(+) transhydrogenase subunit alpha [Hyphomicrobiaceae bacterium]|jgi:NAD(P) transhydrogenase subunit alpha
MVTIAVTAERDGEPRVAVSPETVKKLTALGIEVKVEAGAGAASRFSDDLLKAQGAQIAPTAREALTGADILLKVRRPTTDEVKTLKSGAIVAAMLAPYDDRDGLAALAGTGAVLMAMELMPRISRAQSMDVLSSQANLAGYKAVIDAAAMFRQALPMMMTAAGTVPAAKVFIMGVGVAGLQAIATARRLGAIVSATDVRPATKEQVASLGAKFIAVEDEEFKQAQTAAGYAKPMSAAYQNKQAELVAAHIKGQDIVIATALIPGRPAPRLITAAMVESMKAGSVIVDLAAERGGNCELTQPDKVVAHNGVSIVGPLNLAGEVAVNASGLYAKNLLAFLETMIDKQQKALKVNWDDELIKGTLVARDGKIVHPSLQPGGPQTPSQPPQGG